MLKRTLIVLSLTLALVVALEPVQTVHGVLLTEAELFAANTTAAVNNSGQRSGGNGFMRALGAPFRAIGRLFGRGKKDSNKLERISEKDARRFESTPGVQVTNHTAAPAKQTAPPNDAAAAATSAPDNAGITLSSRDTAAERLAAVAAEHLVKGRALLDSNDLNAAIGELSLAASANPKSGDASSLLGVAYYRKGLRDLAERSFLKAVEVAPNDAENLNNLGYLLFENGEFEKATKYLKRAAKLAPGDARIWNNLGLAQAERGKFDDAYESFARAQGPYKGHLNVAARLEHEGSAKKAIKHLELALALQPNSPDVLVRLIGLYYGTGKEQQAQTARASLETLHSLAKVPAQ